MEPLRRIVRSRAFAVLVGAGVAAIAMGAVIATGTSTPLKVCVAAKEGKPLLTPKAGACKTGYTLREVSEEGPPGEPGPPGERGPAGEPGPAGSAVVARVRLNESFVTSNTAASLPLTGASWSQSSEEVQQLVGQMTLSVPNRAECGGAEGEPALFSARVKLNGATLGEASTLNLSPGAQTLALEWKHSGGGSGLESAYWLAEPGTEAGRSLTVEASDTCGFHHSRHFTVESLAIAVVGER